jgi:hypothetical protein
MSAAGGPRRPERDKDFAWADDDGPRAKDLRGELEAFIEECRTLQAAAARLCKDGSGLSREAREHLNRLRVQLLATRKFLASLPTQEQAGQPKP